MAPSKRICAKKLDFKKAKNSVERWRSFSIAGIVMVQMVLGIRRIGSSTKKDYYPPLDSIKVS
jgi:hypothetical protein